MRVGFTPIFQNLGQVSSDTEVYRQELRLAKLVESLGFDAVWSTEHHFKNYQMIPDPLLFLSHMAGTSETLEIGAMCVVVPWHDPLRVAEQVILLDHLCRGRFTLGIARGAAPSEFAGFRVDMSASRDMLIEYSQMILAALETGVAAFDGKVLKQPRVEIRPRPFRSFKGRTYFGSTSPDTMEITARLGGGILINPAKPWDAVAKEAAGYHADYRKYHGDDPVPAIVVSFVFCDEDPVRAKELGAKYLGAYWRTLVDHYGFNKPDNFQGKKGYEYYVEDAKVQQATPADETTRGFLNLQVYGTPDECYEKIMEIRSHVCCSQVNCIFGYGGMPYPEMERSMRLFAKTVVPRLKRVPNPAVFTSNLESPALKAAS